MNMSKYKAKRITVDGISFSSKIEAARYQHLKNMEDIGEISLLVLQPRYNLLPGFVVDGQKIRPMGYVADFSYINKYGRIIVEDVKGFKTAEYKLKRKLFLYKYAREYAIMFYEITKANDSRPFDLEEI